ncbi:MAG: hypothetical protein QNJ07_04985 [Woeseiaceae bacterium]|nr:hypothetical protein [Woeseiaceae bacterium]
MLKRKSHLFLTVLVLAAGTAQAAQSANGTAVVRADDQEYTIPIVCDDTSHPESGLYTEPQRITRERTGRASGVRLTIRPWKDTSQLVVSLGRYVAWVPVPAHVDGKIEMTLAMSPASSLRDGVPAALTYDQWMAGDRPPGLDKVRIEADCRKLNPHAPAYRKLEAAE